MTITTEALDPAAYSVAEDWFTAGEFVEPLVEDPSGPGDPDTEDPGPIVPDPAAPWLPVARSRGPRVGVLIGRAVSREVVGPLLTAEVGDWIDEVELLAGTAADITASSFDPMWEELAESTSLKADGTLGYTWDPRGYIVWVYRDGVPVWTGAFFQPIEIGGGRVRLPAMGPQEQLGQRFLGRAEQVDLLNDAGSFERYSSIAQMEADGWVFPSGVVPQLVSDGVRGSKCLRVRGAGMVRTPKVTVTGADGYGRVVDWSVFGKWTDAIPDGTTVAVAYVQRTDALVVSNEAYSNGNAGVRPNDEAGWTTDPVQFAARMSPQAVAHSTWAGLRSFDDNWSYYDLATARLSVQTGFPPGTERDLADHLVRVMRDLAAQSIGGYPHGLTSRIVSRTGVLASMRWPHARRTPVSDVVGMILNAEGGPECRITPGWNLLIHARLGSDRADIALTNRVVVAPGWQVDAGAQYDDYAVDTGRGSGAVALFATVSQPAREDRFRQQAIVQGPTDRTLNELERWARAHARAAARRQATAEVEVPWHVADQIVCGDSLWVALSDGDLVLDERMRVLRKRWVPSSMLCVLTLGATDA